MLEPLVRRQLEAFLAEDIGHGDITTQNLPQLEGKVVRAALRSREEGVLAGLDYALELFRLRDPDLTVASGRMKDGDSLIPGSVLAEIQGQATALLTAERTALNLLQRLSGIATAARRCAQALEGSRTRILDTRKTTPGFRYFEKYAVQAGGGSNHRMGLSDGVMIKDNHIAAAGGITAAVQAVRTRVPVTIRMEVEADTLEQVKEAVEAGADIILLDNMSEETLKEAIRIVGGRAMTEASGGVTLEDLPRLGLLGLDFISTSSMMTRSRWLDIGLDFE